jgi:hypothetical protein
LASFARSQTTDSAVFAELMGVLSRK